MKTVYVIVRNAEDSDFFHVEIFQSVHANLAKAKDELVKLQKNLPGEVFEILERNLA